jgi:TFIIF-interacting CTD phosphatase-like protein
MVLELKASKQVSYYGKALLNFEGENIELLSYLTSVASFDTIKKELKIKAFYSKTTLKHIKDFINFINERYTLQIDNTSTKALQNYLVKQ